MKCLPAEDTDVLVPPLELPDDPIYHWQHSVNILCRLTSLFGFYQLFSNYYILASFVPSSNGSGISNRLESMSVRGKAEFR